MIVACGSGTSGSHRGANPRENRGPAQSYFLGGRIDHNECQAPDHPRFRLASSEHDLERACVRCVGPGSYCRRRLGDPRNVSRVATIGHRAVRRRPPRACERLRSPAHPLALSSSPDSRHDVASCRDGVRRSIPGWLLFPRMSMRDVGDRHGGSFAPRHLTDAEAVKGSIELFAAPPQTLI